MMMITTSLTTPSLDLAQAKETLVSPSSTEETVIPNRLERDVDEEEEDASSSSSYLPVITAKDATAPESFIELFWHMSRSVTKAFKQFMDEGLALWVEAFGNIQMAEPLNRSILSPIHSHRSPAFRLRAEDTEASLVSSLIAERRLASVDASPERSAWLSANQWSGLDDLFPLESELKERVALNNTVSSQSETSPVVSSVINILPLSQVGQVTSSNILNALHQAYPPALVISSEEEAACLEHPISQRGREVKLNINQLVDDYFATEASAV
jgi:hypothetical protein